MFVSNTQEYGKTVQGREIEQNLMSFFIQNTLYTLLVIIMTGVVGEWGFVVLDHAIVLLLTHKLNMEDKHTKSLKSMKIFFTEKFFHARVMEKQSTARIINFHQIYRI